MAGRDTAQQNKILGFNSNIIYFLSMVALSSFGLGFIEAGFNLYILSMGMSPDMLGVILSLKPFAMVLTAIPIGFIAEKIGSKRSLILVNTIVGLAHLLRVSTPNQTVIMAGSILIGILQPGYFIVQMPLIKRYSGENMDREFAAAMLVVYAAGALGNLAGGFLPEMVSPLVANATIAFRAVMIIGALLITAGTIPLALLKKDKPADTRKISLSPYLSGIDRNTVKSAIVEFFLGLGFGFLMYFMNIIFVYYYGSTLEAYGTMSAVMVIPIVLFILFGPKVAEKLGGLRVSIYTRIVGTLTAALVVLTRNPWIGGAAYILYRAMLGLGNSLWLSFASAISTERSRTATSTWLEITFQIGFGIAALYGGHLVGMNAYPALGWISAGAMALTGLLPYLFYRREYLQKADKAA